MPSDVPKEYTIDAKYEKLVDTTIRRTIYGAGVAGVLSLLILRGLRHGECLHPSARVSASGPHGRSAQRSSTTWCRSCCGSETAAGLHACSSWRRSREQDHAENTYGAVVAGMDVLKSGKGVEEGRG